MDCDTAEVLIAELEVGRSCDTALADLAVHVLVCPGCRSLYPEHAEFLAALRKPLRVFEGTRRFELGREIGRGGSGIVFRAYDHRCTTEVALKLLADPDPTRLRRFKAEFRGLRELRHTNLVRLHELVEHTGHWFFTMELVDGFDVLRWVRSEHTFDEARLRAALLGLVTGLSVLHDAGKMHCDIKPSNILVEQEGRVVLVDFGLVRDLRVGVVERLGGTPAFAAPEQLVGPGALPASDLWSTGVVLYQALTGRLPFGELPIEVVLSRGRLRVPAPSLLAHSVPKDLERLCMALLSLDATARPTAADVIREFRGRSWSEPRPQHRVRFVGRKAEIESLERAFVDAKAGTWTTALVVGESGIGKTALVAEVCERWRRKHGALVLAGRCGEHESIPYKAFDGIADELARYIENDNRISSEDREALAWIFPALAVRDRGSNAYPSGGPGARRMVSFRALRNVLRALAQRQPIVLWIDDLQWTDGDSLALLNEVARAPDAPPILMIACAWHDMDPITRAEVPCESLERAIRISVTPLALNDAVELVRELSPKGAAADVRAIVNESGGHPLFAQELVRAVARRSCNHDVSLDDLIGERLEPLEPHSRRLLEMIAVASVGIEHDLLADAVSLQHDVFARGIDDLVERRLIRRVARSDASWFEIHHHRISVVTLARLDGGGREVACLSLAQAFERRGATEPEQLATLWSGAGRPERALEYEMAAAKRAEEALAFDRSAHWYRVALARRELVAVSRLAVLARLADVLVRGGRPIEAADVLSSMAAHEHGTAALDARRRAAECLLHGGRVDQGIVALREVLRETGIPWPATRRAAFVGLVARRAWMKVRGLGVARRPTGEGSISTIDACWSAAIGLSLIDPILSGHFQARHFSMALRHGEPVRVVRALTMEAAHRALAGRHTRASVRAILANARARAEAIARTDALAYVMLIEVLVPLLWCEWPEARRRADAAELYFLRMRQELGWHVRPLQLYSLWAQFHCGEVTTLCERVPHLLAEAEERGDRFAVANFGTGLANFAWLLRGDVAGAMAARQRAMAGWSDGGEFLLQGIEDLSARVQIALYECRGCDAWADVKCTWPALRRSFLLHIQVARVEALDMRARSALAASRVLRGSAGKLALRSAEKDARLLLREQTPWSTAAGHAILAGVAIRRGATDAAKQELKIAAEGFERAGMTLHSACTRLHIGVEEAELAHAWLRAQGVRSPTAIAVVLFPGSDYIPIFSS